ncbi:MAG: citramalate synthase [Candidatus Merdivicinus sp.]|jgi:2-isopropylmalate synthase
MDRLFVFDSTLRDGAQGESISFSVNDKLNILKLLDGLGIPYIEAGNPSSNPKDREFFEKASHIALKHAKLVAFGSTRRPGSHAAEDAGLDALLSARTEVVAIFGKASAFHVEQVLRTSREENLRMIEDSIRFLAANGRTVFFDAEHYFDGYREDPAYAMQVVRTAAHAGAACVILCDTNGGTLPHDIYQGVQSVCQAVEVPVGIHCHNDIGCAVANSLMAVQAGAVQVQGTLLGFGERCGNANLSALIPSLQLKMGYDCIPPEQMENLTRCVRAVGEASNIVPDNGMPYVGKSAFAHKGGMHIDGVKKVPSSFEHIDPALVGNSRSLLISEVSGRAAVAGMVGDDPHHAEAAEIVQMVKEQEHEGFQYEYASASLQLLILHRKHKLAPYFEVIYSRTIGEQRGNWEGTGNGSSAVVKVRVGENCEIGGGEGEGPVHALDCALRKAVGRFYPSIEDVRLIDYKVRVIEPQDATAAKVRVLVESTDGKDVWTTVGVSRDIIQASLQACVDAVEYKLWMEQKMREGQK